MQPPFDPLATMAAHAASGLGVQLRSLPNGKFRMEVSEGSDVWTSFHAGHPGFDSPAEAIAATDERIPSWKLAREDAGRADVVHFLEADRLERRRITIQGELGPQEVDGYAAKADDGSFVEAVTPAAAVKAAKDRTLQKAAERGSAQGARP